MGLPLKKKVELVGLRLKKFKVPENLIARVVMVNDGSGSMADLYGVPVSRYPKGHVSAMQETIDRCTAVAVRFDDNQSLEQFIFDSGCRRLPDATPETFGTYVQNELIPNFHGGSTVYSSALKEIINTYDNPPSDEPTEGKVGFFGKLFGKKPEVVKPAVAAPVDASLPMFVMFTTDGDNAYGDGGMTEHYLTEALNRNIYIMFLGIGTQGTFSALSEYADRFPNVGFAKLTDIANISDEQLYETLLNEEFCTWINKFAPAAAAA